MSKNNNRNRPRTDSTVQASDTQKTAADEKVDVAKVVEGSHTDSTGSKTQNPDGATQSSTNDSDRNDEADQARAEEERKEAERLEEEQRAELARRNTSATQKVEVRVLRNGHFGTINDVVSIPRGIVEAAEADGSVCSHPASVAEAKALAKGG